MKILGIKHVTTTSYHPQSNGLVENLHRRLKDALRMQKFPIRWYYDLPVVMMVIHATLKEELNCTPAELVYGQDLRLPGEFKTETKPDFLQRDTLVHNLKEFIRELKPVSPRVHAEVKSYLDKNLQDCKLVLVRNDAVLPPLSPRFSGPYKVIKRHEKYFVLQDSKSGAQKSVSIDRLKAYHSMPESAPPTLNNPVEKQPISSSSATKPEDESTKSIVRTRAGREVKPPDRLKM